MSPSLLGPTAFLRERLTTPVKGLRWGEGAVFDAQHRLCFTDVNAGRIRTINVRGGAVNLTSGTGPKADTLFTAPSAVYAYPLDPAQRA